MCVRVGLLFTILEGGCTFPFLWQITQGINLRKHFLAPLLRIWGLRRKGDVKNGSSTGSKSVKHLVPSLPQSGMNAAAQLVFTFFHFYSLWDPPLPGGWCHLYSRWSSLLIQLLWKHPHSYTYISHIHSYLYPISISFYILSITDGK